METNNVLFSEVQRNSSWVTVLLVLVGAGLLILLLALAFSRLETRIHEDGIQVRYFPFQRQFRSYPWPDISKVYIRDYSPLSEYGGWGLKGVSDDKVMSVRGKSGLQLRFRDGKRLLIGTGKAEEIRSILTKTGHYTGE